MKVIECDSVKRVTRLGWVFCGFWLVALAAGPTSVAAIPGREAERAEPAAAPAQNSQQPNPRGGAVLRIPGFDLRQPGAQFGGGRAIKYERGADGIGYVNLTAVTSANTVRLVPNRNYVMSVLMKADFTRPTEVNVGLRTFDGGGKNVIDNLNGVPNKTNGWQRWEWEFTVDPRATHGQFRANVYQFTQDCERRREHR